jgi:membrane protease YdiL (CAAX protease family)
MPLDYDKRKLSVEIIVILSLTVGRSLVNTLGRSAWLGSVPVYPFVYYHFGEILRGLSIILLIVLIIWLKNEPWRELGLLSPGWIRDILFGLTLLLIQAVLWLPLEILLKQLGVPTLSDSQSPFLKPSTTWEVPWLLVSAIVTGLAEELLIRGYLISRLARLLGRWETILVSSFIFSLWHVSQGIVGVSHTFLWGVIFGISFTKNYRLWPLVVAHAVNNAVIDLFALTDS